MRFKEKDILSEKIRGALYDLVARQGQTFQNVSEIAENLARSGMNFTDTITVTENTLITLNKIVTQTIE